MSSPIKVCCFGSSSARTPQSYLDAAFDLGVLVAERGHVCVNGGGKDGCMGALNRGALSKSGAILGVIHEMWIGEEEQPCIELVVARGTDLAERKRLLFEHADVIISLPGGYGTMDEAFEAIAARQLGLASGAAPICLVNTDGFFDPTVAHLDRMFADGLLRRPWQEVVGVCDTPVAALDWCMEQLRQQERAAQPAKDGSSTSS